MTRSTETTATGTSETTREADSAGTADSTETADSVSVVVRACGHANVSAAHESTLEVTTEEFLTPAGDCIIGIGADAAPADVPDGFVEACRSRDARISLSLRVCDETGVEHVETVSGRGHPNLSFENETSMVVRTSEYIDDRTVMVEANKAAADLDRAFVDSLAAGGDLRATLRVE